MYTSRDRGSFISVASIDPASFDYLLQAFSKFYIVKRGIGKRGRPPKFIFKHAVLAYCIIAQLPLRIRHYGSVLGCHQQRCRVSWQMQSLHLVSAFGFCQKRVYGSLLLNSSKNEIDLRKHESLLYKISGALWMVKTIAFKNQPKLTFRTRTTTVWIHEFTPSYYFLTHVDVHIS